MTLRFEFCSQKAETNLFKEIPTENTETSFVTDVKQKLINMLEEYEEESPNNRQNPLAVAAQTNFSSAANQNSNLNKSKEFKIRRYSLNRGSPVLQVNSI